MSGMTCREFVEFLMEYLNGELAAETRAEFDRHLALCAPCVAYLRQYQDTVRLGRAAFQASDEPVPESVPEALVQAILEARHRSGGVRRGS